MNHYLLFFLATMYIGSVSTAAMLLVGMRRSRLRVWFEKSTQTA